jgi:hypothetical protein
MEGSPGFGRHDLSGVGMMTGEMRAITADVRSSVRASSPRCCRRAWDRSPTIISHLHREHSARDQKPRQRSPLSRPGLCHTP